MSCKFCPLLSIAAGVKTKSDCSGCEWGEEIYNPNGDQETCLTWRCSIFRNDGRAEMVKNGPL